MSGAAVKVSESKQPAVEYPELAEGLDLSIPPGQKGNQWAQYRSRVSKKVHGRNHGREAGVPNKVTADMQEAVRTAFERKGGIKYLMKLADENPEIFGRMLIKLMPTTIEAEVKHGLSTVVERILAGREATARLREAQPTMLEAGADVVIEHEVTKDDED